MATSGDNMNTLQCDKCKQKVLQPLIFECSHKLCSSCLSQQDEPKNTCCLCRGKCNNNSQERIDEKLCSLCYRPSVTSYCTDCELELCELCRSAHIKIPSCIDHNMISVNDFQRQGSTLSRNCRKHRSNFSKYHCIQCNVVICAECKIEAHDNHPVETVKQAYDNVVEKTRGHIHLITHNKKLIRKRLEHVVELKKQCQVQREQIIRDINLHTRDVIQKVQSDCRILTETVESRSNLKIKELDMMKTDLENNLHCLADFVELGSATISKRDSKGAVECLHILQNDGLFEKIKASANEAPLGENEFIKLLDIQFNLKPSIENNNMVGYIDIEGKDVPLKPNLLDVKLPPAVKPKKIPPAVKPKPKHVKSRQNTGSVTDINWSHQKEFQEVQHHGMVQQQTIASPEYLATKAESFRITKTHLEILLIRPLDHIRTFRIHKSCGRLCYFQQNFWFPCYKECDNCIDIYDTNGNKLTEIKNPEIIFPISIHPNSSETLIVAAFSGLFLISSTGELIKQILHGKFSDVHVNGDKIVALEKITDKNDMIYILENTNPPRLLSKFYLENNFSRMLIMNNHDIFVTFYEKSSKLSHIIKYSHIHEPLLKQGRYGKKSPGSLDLPIPCILDTQGSLLVADSNNKQMQILDNQDQWSIIKQKIFPKNLVPLDVVISKKVLFILWCDPVNDSMCIMSYNI